MKRIFTIMLLCAMFSVSALAQSGLHVNKLFSKYRKMPNAVEVYVTGQEAERLKLSLYRSLTLTSYVDGDLLLEPSVVKDGVSALDKEVEYRDGKLYYGFYTLPARKFGNETVNRYLFYLNQNLANKKSVNKITIIYLEGKADADFIKSLIRK